MDDLRVVKVLTETPPASLSSKSWYNTDTYDVVFELNRSADSHDRDIISNLWLHAMRQTTDAAPNTRLSIQGSKLTLSTTTIKDVEEWQLDLLTRVLADGNKRAHTRRAEAKQQREAEASRAEAHRAEMQQAARRINQRLASD